MDIVCEGNCARVEEYQVGKSVVELSACMGLIQKLLNPRFMIFPTPAKNYNLRKKEPSINIYGKICQRRKHNSL